MKIKYYLGFKPVICGFFVLLSSQVYGQLYETEKFEYSEAKGYFSMSYIDTVKINEFSEDTTEKINTLDFVLIKKKTGELNLVIFCYDIQGENFRVLVRYKDNSIVDSKTNKNIFYSLIDHYFVHNFIRKPILKIRISGESISSDMIPRVYDITGFKRTNSMFNVFITLNYKQLNNKFNKNRDIYDGF